MTRGQRLALLSAAFALAVAGGAQLSAAQTGSPSPGQARYIIGKAYQFDGVWYQPAVDYGYDDTGIASVYPSRAAGLATTSGEFYDANAMAAAHKTLPLPSMARVTNLENGKSVELRINDRGPFVDDRIVELTPAAAQALGISGQASARVRVQILAEKSQALAASLGGGDNDQAPALKVTSLPLLGGPAVQPLKPVAAPEPAISSSPPAAPTVAATTTTTSAAVSAPVPVAEPVPAATPTAAAEPPPAAPTAEAVATTPVAAQPPLAPPTLFVPPAAAASIAAKPAQPAVSAPAPAVATAPAATVATVTPVAPVAIEPAPPEPVAAPELPLAADSGSTQPASAGAPATEAPLASVALAIPAAPAQGASGAFSQPNSAATKPLPVDLPAQFFIQTGAFRAPGEANKLRAKLAALGTTKIVPTRLGTEDFNAVLLGPIASMSEAQKLLKQIGAMGYSDAVLVIQ